MKAKKKIYVAIVLVVFTAILLICYFIYIPPLLDERGYNFPGRIYDFFAYAYYSSRMDWLKNAGKDQASLRAGALAGWYRPSKVIGLLGVNPDELFLLGRRYASLELDKQALQLFRAALSTINEEAKSLEVISYLTILDDWSGTVPVARALLAGYPESAEGNYWLGRALLELGRPNEAAPFLQSAFRIDRSLVDALYQLARVDEESGREDSALAQYENVVSVLPGHLEAWQALERLYGKRGEEENWKESRMRAGELIPPEISSVDYKNKTVILGYILNRQKLRTEEELSLDLYIKGWRPGSVNLRIVARLVSVDFWGNAEERGEPFFIKTAGEVAEERLTWKNPFGLYPGNYRLEIAIEELDTDGAAATISDQQVYRTLTTLKLSPRWLPARRRDRLVSEHFGERANPLEKRTFLGPGSELTLDFDEKNQISAVGMVSSSQCYASFPQGKEIARITLHTAEGGEFKFPVRAGVETSKCWWEAVVPRKRKHRLAPVFRSWPVRSGETEFQAYEYRTLFPLPHPSAISSMSVKNVSENAGFSITDIILIPGEVESDLNP